MKNIEAVYEKLKCFIESNRPNPPLRGLPEENPLKGLTEKEFPEEEVFSPDRVSPRITPLSGGDGERSETEGVREVTTLLNAEEGNPPNPPLRGLAKEDIFSPD